MTETVTTPEPEDLTLRPISGRDEHDLFTRLPYVLDDELAYDLDAGRRPEWVWVALRGDRLVARAAWWTRPRHDTPYIFDVFDLDPETPDRVDVGAGWSRRRWPRSSPGRPAPGVLSPRLARRDCPAVRGPVKERMYALERLGARLFVERLRFEWRAGTPVPAPPGRPAFRPVDGVDHNPIIAYIGVRPARRGSGYVDEILAEGTRVLAAEGVSRIRASTDLGNVPMARAFHRAGYTAFEERIVMTWDRGTRPGARGRRGSAPATIADDMATPGEATPAVRPWRVGYSTRPAPGAVNEDYVVAGPRWAVVLDGATAPTGVDGGCVHDVPWLVRHLAAALGARLAAGDAGSLADVLAGAIKQVCAAHGDTCDLADPDSPSSTVAMARWGGGSFECLVLADSPIVVRRAGGPVVVVEDDRVTRLPGGPPYTRELVRTHRNRPGGFWVASTSQAAAYEAVTATFPEDEVETAALLTDGVTRLVERYGHSWEGLLTALGDHGPDHVIGLVREAERAEAAPYGKRHDDATALVIR